MDELKKVLEGTEQTVIGRLDGLSKASLEQLLSAEQGDVARQNVIKAIEAAIAKADDDGKTAVAKGEDEGDKPIFTQAQFDAELVKREDAWKADTARQVAAAKGKAAPKPAKPKPAEPLVIGQSKEGFSLRSLTQGASVVFVDDDDVPLPDLPAMTFTADAFEPSGESVRLARKVTFPNALPANEVSGAFLMFGDTPLAKARLIGAQPIGGGRDVELPAGTLMFAKE